MRHLWNKLKAFWRWLWHQLRDWHNLVIFAATAAVLSCEVWIPYVVWAITGNKWWLAVGSVCWAFWLAPFTPFVPLCIAITSGIRAIADRVRQRHHTSHCRKGDYNDK